MAARRRLSKQQFNFLLMFVVTFMIIILWNAPGGVRPGGSAQNDTAVSESQDSQNQANTTDMSEVPPEPLSAPSLISEANDYNIETQSWVTRNGARVRFVPLDALPMVDVRLFFNAGAARDGEQHGLARLTNGVMPEGTTTRTVDEIVSGFERLGVQYGNASYRDMAQLRIRSLSSSDYLDPALELLVDVVANPSFPDGALERTRQQMLVALTRKQQSPGQRAQDAFMQTLYKGHDYGTPPDGSETALRALTANDLRRFHQQYYVARNLTIAMAGALSIEEARAVSERISQALPEGEAASPIALQPRLSELQNMHIEHDASQTQVLIGNTGIARGHDDFFALYVGNEVLGAGGFTSRLTNAIRQDRGLVYSIYSYFSAMSGNGPFAINFKTRADQSDEAIGVAKKVLRDFIEQGPTDEELQDAKDHIINSFPLSTASNAQIVGYIGSLGFYDMPADYLNRYISNVKAVTKDDVMRAFKEQINPDHLLVVTAGPTVKNDDAP